MFTFYIFLIIVFFCYLFSKLFDIYEYNKTSKKEAEIKKEVDKFMKDYPGSTKDQATRVVTNVGVTLADISIMWTSQNKDPR